MQSTAKINSVSIAFISGFALLLLLVCCGPSQKQKIGNTASLSNVTLKVDGMKKVNGFV